MFPPTRSIAGCAPRRGRAHSGLPALLVFVLGLVLPIAAPSSAGAAPRMTTMEPLVAPVSGGTLATITGTGLDEIEHIRFYGARATIVSRTPTQITLRTPPQAAPTTVTVSADAVNDAESYDAGAFNFEYVELVSTMTPDRGPQTGGNDVTFTGIGMDRVRSVSFCPGVSVTSFVDQRSGSLTLKAPRCPPNTVSVVVTAPDWGSGYAPGSYDFRAVPIVTSLGPARGPTSGGTSVTVAGDHLAEVASVRFGAATATVVGNRTDTAMTVVSPPGTAGAATVTLTNVDGYAATSSFTYEAPVPGPSPSPDPSPSPEPSPSPSPGPGPGASPQPSATPSPEPSPQPGPTPGVVTPDPGAPSPLSQSAPGASTAPVASPAPGPGSTIPVPSLAPGAPLSGAPRPASRCTLAVKGKTLAKATTAIRKSGCKVGRVKRPKTIRRGSVLVVGGARLAKGSTTKVDVTLVAKRR